jgi:hypothetical protein
VTRADILLQLDELRCGQTYAESIMIAGIIHHGELSVAENALDEAMRTTGLRAPVGLEPQNGLVLGAVMDLLNLGVPISPDSVADQMLGAGDEPPKDLIAAVYGLAEDSRVRGGELSPFPPAREVADTSAKRLNLGQRVWPEALYRWFDWDDRLLYVGITRTLAARQEAHAKASSWSRFAVNCTVERYPNRDAVELAERYAIEEERPLFNHVHNDTPEARERLVEYLVEHGHLDLLLPAVNRG